MSAESLYRTTNVISYAVTFLSLLGSFHIGNLLKSAFVLWGSGFIYPAGAFVRHVFCLLSIAGGDIVTTRETLTSWITLFDFNGLDQYMNVSISEMRALKESPIREGLMTMSNSLIAQEKTFKLILCPFLSELWKCSVWMAAAGSNEHGEWRLIPNQPGRICKER